MSALEISLIWFQIAELTFILCLIRSYYDLKNLTRSYCQARDEAWEVAWYRKDALTVLIQHLRRGGSIAIIGCFGADTHALIKKHEEELDIPHD